MPIIIKKLTKKYDDKNVLDSFSLDFPDRGIVCLFGPSGCGKTTLLNCIAGLEKSDSGTITGLERKRVSFMFQEDRLISWISALDNVQLVMDKNSPATPLAIDYLDMVGLKNDALSLPQGLSGGMSRRVSFARTLSFRGDVYLLDEPFKGLDTVLKERLIDTVKQLGENALVIMVTHEIEEAKSIADKILLLEGPPLRIKESILP